MLLPSSLKVHPAFSAGISSATASADSGSVPPSQGLHLLSTRSVMGFILELHGRPTISCRPARCTGKQTPCGVLEKGRSDRVFDRTGSGEDSRIRVFRGKTRGSVRLGPSFRVGGN